MSKRQKSVEGRLWVRVIKGHRALHDATVPCFHDDPQSALRDVMHDLDLSMPVWLPRHQDDWQRFSLTRFRPEHFLEPVNFDRVEISFIFPDDDEEAKRKRVDRYI